MLKVVILGTGNVAKHLFDAFSASTAVETVQVLGRNPDAVKYFEEEALVFGMHEVIEDPDVYIIAVNDDSISTVSESLIGRKGLIAHTSGSVSLEVLAQHGNHGIFYPLQTFSKERPIDFKSVPLCIEANTEKNKSVLRALAASVSDRVYDIDSRQRRSLHLAAVFANNFTNHLYHLAHELCEEHQVPFDILKPLITETAKKIELESPYEMQTGPARRGDKATMDKQLGLLNSPWQKELYSLLSKSIKRTYQKHL
ncbi:DUF2520 domain-containing protein [Flavobacteriaceae bacterium TP-CH-4]|uniref:DUF2520 domain-containing protein n=1 Tax=Pelagihabitans pacificus TaxID=2696054 RepID=A0A967AVQ0_9FLAO|nr:Rossmann-like and DUF2520 domain-containing protein [Pelagihabitans pacificus]NHF60245.1 DUF2520 domain-containing protein [Pelagihabitans pacificus]